MRGVTCMSKASSSAQSADLQRASDQIGAIQLASDAHGERQFAGSVRQVFDALVQLDAGGA